MHLTSGFLDFVALLAFVNATHTLASSTEETFHAVQIDNSLCTLLLFLLDLVHLVILLVLLLNATIVTKPVLLLLST